MLTRATAKKNCQWISGIPFYVPERWNCKEIVDQNVTSIRATLFIKIRKSKAKSWNEKLYLQSLI
ncbi:hypothetical protein X798_07474 [Onchocerca flexuosa]|uniref:Uncharacterized protein n=1 Tax=Onchocerca flexuosa TaxID=387005 RepID=A0A238BJV6_9BILA|nr:hypothetical protein X798_07474 [Onchocerca flexuosa]